MGMAVVANMGMAMVAMMGDLIVARIGTHGDPGRKGGHLRFI
jgi:hypothetical protein